MDIYDFTDKGRVLLFFGFIVYCFFSFLLRLFSIKPVFLKQLDARLTSVTAFYGVILFILWVGFVFFKRDEVSYVNMMDNRNLFNWILAGLFNLSTLFLLTPVLSRSLLIRLLIAVFGMVSFPKLVVFITTLHRGHFSMSLFTLSFGEFLIYCIISLFFYLVVTLVLHFIYTKLIKS